jgi:hypothetical protein
MKKNKKAKYMMLGSDEVYSSLEDAVLFGSLSRTIENNKPMEEFKTQEELNECLKWWKDKLFLNDWIIKAKLCAPDDFAVDGRMGENSMVFENKESMIRILEKQYYPNDAIAIYCAEQTLVHELLHCKYNFLQNKGTYESIYVDVVEHQSLEQMAKSLIMAKYNLDFDYFRSQEVIRYGDSSLKTRRNAHERALWNK